MIKHDKPAKIAQGVVRIGLPMHPKAPSTVHNPTEFVAADPQHQHPPNLKF
jgi:hypothetical protein